MAAQKPQRRVRWGFPCISSACITPHTASLPPLLPHPVLPCAQTTHTSRAVFNHSVPNSGGGDSQGTSDPVRSRCLSRSRQSFQIGYCTRPPARLTQQIPIQIADCPPCCAPSLLPRAMVNWTDPLTLALCARASSPWLKPCQLNERRAQGHSRSSRASASAYTCTPCGGIACWRGRSRRQVGVPRLVQVRLGALHRQASVPLDVRRACPPRLSLPPDAAHGDRRTSSRGT